MRHHATLAAAFCAAVLAATAGGCSSGGPAGGTAAAGTAAPRTAEQVAQPAQGSPATVTTKSVPLGKILVDGKDRTLYLFQADKSTDSTCTGACAKAWPPLTVNGKPTASGGADAKKLGTTKRSDGSTQVTYNGHPLYRFAADTKPGNVRGQGVDAFGAKWYVLGTDGKQITKSPSPVPGGGY